MARLGAALAVGLTLTSVRPQWIGVHSQFTCACTTGQCGGLTTCSGASMCFTEYLKKPNTKAHITKGCIHTKTSLLCENRPPAVTVWPTVVCCKSNMCNEELPLSIRQILSPPLAQSTTTVGLSSVVPGRASPGRLEDNRSLEAVNGVRSDQIEHGVEDVAVSADAHPDARKSPVPTPNATSATSTGSARGWPAADVYGGERYASPSHRPLAVWTVSDERAKRLLAELITGTSQPVQMGASESGRIRTDSDVDLGDRVANRDNDDGSTSNDALLGTTYALTSVAAVTLILMAVMCVVSASLLRRLTRCSSDVDRLTDEERLTLRASASTAASAVCELQR